MPRISRCAPLLVGSALAVALVASPVAADTTGGPTNVDYALAGSPDGNSTVQMSHDYLTGTYRLFASTSSATVIACGNGQDGEIDVSVNGQGTPSTFAFGRQLSSASASGSIPAFRDVYNSCSGEQTEEAVTMSVSMALIGTKYMSTSTFRTVTKNPDGTTTVYSGKMTSVTATGTFSIDGVATTASDASINHDEVTVKTR